MKSDSLITLRRQISHAAADRDSHVASAQKALSTTVEPARHNRAELKGTEEQIQELWDAVNEVRQTNERSESFRTSSMRDH